MLAYVIILLSMVADGSGASFMVPSKAGYDEQGFGDLVPSQVLGSHRHKRHQGKQKYRPRTMPSNGDLLAPSVNLMCKPRAENDFTTDLNSNATSFRNEDRGTSKDRSGSHRNRRRRDKRNNRRKSRSSTENSSGGKSEWKKKWMGNLPDIAWRAIPMDHLRQHPNFVPLPESVSVLECLEDVRQFRQDSWQWDALHEGRCTTSQVAAALGFLDPLAGECLGIPLSWQRGGLGAYHRLSNPAMRTLEEFKQRLVESEYIDPASKQDNDSPRLWLRSKSLKDRNGQLRPFPFAAKYLVRITEEERQRRRRVAQKYTCTDSFRASFRLMWGNSQEATALLTALNYFWKQDNKIVMNEVGMCGAGLASNQTDEYSLLLGASPDALICHPDGCVEVVEVKNHCPFFFHFTGNDNQKKQANKSGSHIPKQFSFRNTDFEKIGKGVLPQYLPQLMMEMLCVGPDCRSAVMVRQSGSNGALIMRIKRDDAWIDEMLYWLNKFNQDFVQAAVQPPENFFWNDDSNDKSRSRYRAFVEWTKNLGSKVELLAHIPNAGVQRALGTNARTSRPFLD